MDDYVCYVGFLIWDLNFDPPYDPPDSLLVEIKMVTICPWAKQT